MLVRWAGERRIPPDAEIVPVNEAGEPIGDPTPARAFGPISAIVASPPTSAMAPDASRPPDDFFSTLVPMRNKPALFGYYLALAGLIPCLGFPCCVAALICGFVGYKRWREDPNVRGKAHAIIGIVGGGVMLLAYLALLIVFLVAVGSA
jgi:hypothetical protein